MGLKFNRDNVRGKNEIKKVARRGRPKVQKGLGHDIPTSKFRTVVQQCLVCEDVETHLKPPNKMILQCQTCKSITEYENP